jgi:hypothetical protein
MQELEDLIAEPLPSNGQLRGTSLAAFFHLSDVMLRVTHMLIWYCNGYLFWLHYSAFQGLGGNTQAHREQGDLISLLSFLK